jgi:hypothetical protein
MSRPHATESKRCLFVLLCWVILGVSGCETESPTLLDASILQDTTNANGPYRVMAQVIGDPETTVVELRYQKEGQAEVIEPMEPYDGLVWFADIPGQPAGSRILYFIAVAHVDDLENPQTLPEAAPNSRYAFRILSP